MFKLNQLSFFLLLFFLLGHTSVSQNNIEELVPEMTFEEFLALVKQHHPVIKQANLKLSLAEAKLLKARGAFDPIIEADLSQKDFEGTNYYDKLSTAFKIPTWFGIELKGSFEENSGTYLNPENKVPIDGLYAAGVSLPLAKNLLTNDRMATLKMSKFFIKQSQAERIITINTILYDATKAYLDWFQAENEKEIYKNAIDNANERYNAIIKTINLGQVAAIDSVEAKINLQSRQLAYEAAKLSAEKSKLYASNFIWIQDIPLELEANVVPVLPQFEEFYMDLPLVSLENIALDKHPKLVYYDYKIESMAIDVSLKKNNLLPTIDLTYNFITSGNNQFDAFNTQDYKAGLYFKLPLFLRKERGDLKISQVQLKDSQFERDNQEVMLKNKIEAVNYEIRSLSVQKEIIRNMVSNYSILLKAEERIFFIGESSLFLINSREQKLIEGQLKEIELIVKELDALASRRNILSLYN